MAYIFGAAIKGIWGFVFPREHPHPISTPEGPSTTSDDFAATGIPQAYSNHRMQSAFRTSAAQPSSSSAEGQPENSTENIPWVQIHYAHVSNLRGQLRYLKLVGDKHNCADKVDEYVKRTRQALQDAKDAAVIAGIIPPSSNPALSKRRRSVTFAPDVEVFVHKKAKILPASTAKAPRYTKRTMTRDPPSTEELAALTSSLGKRGRASPEVGMEEEEESMSEKGTKRSRFVYLEKKYWKPCQYEGDATDSEEDDEDDADFAPMPEDMGSSSSGSSMNSSQVSSDDSTPAKDEPVAPATVKNSGVATGDSESSSVSEESSSIPKGSGNKTPVVEEQSIPKSTKHTAEEEASNQQTSSKKQKKNNTLRLIEDSSKRRAEHAEESVEVVSGGNTKKQKRV